MPVYKIQAPNGKIYKIEAPEGARDEDLFAYVQQQMTLDSLIPPAPKEQAGFWGAFKDSIATLGLADEAAAFAANPTAENREAFLNAAESKYRYAGGFGTGENWNTFKELLGGSLGALVAPIATGVVGAGAGPAGAIGGFAGTSAAQYSIQNLQRQAEELQKASEAGLPVEDVDLGKAAIASAAQAGLDVIPGALILKGLRKFPLAQRLFAEDKVSEQAADILIDAFQKGNISRTGSVVKGVGLGASFEIPQEIAQQALERWQAGLSLTDDEAKEEFKQAAIGAAILGGVFGAVGGYATYRGTRAEGEQVIGGVEEDAEIEAQREEELRRMREGEIEDETLREAPPPQKVSVEDEDAEIEAQRQAEFEQMRQAEEERLLLEEAGQVAPRRLDEQITEQPQLDEELQRRLDRDQAKVRSLRLQDLRQQRPDLDSGTIDYLIEQGLTDKQILKFQLPERRGEPLPYEDEEGAEITVPPAPIPTESTAPAPSTEGVLEGLGAPVGGGIPAKMFEPSAPTEPTTPAPDPRDVALEVIKTTPTIKAISEATGLNQPQAAAIMRGFIDEGVVERVGNKFRLITPEATDVPSAAVTTTETDTGAGGRGVTVPPSGETAAQPSIETTEPAGLDIAGDDTQRADVGEGDVSAPLEAAAPTRAADLRAKAIDFVQRTGKGSAIALQKELGIELAEAKILREALLGSGAVVQTTNVRGGKPTKGSYYYVPQDLEVTEQPQREGRSDVYGRTEDFGTDQERQTLERAGMAPFVEEEVVPEAETRRREMDVAAEREAAIPKQLPPTLKPEIGKGEYGLRYTDPEGNTVYRAFENTAQRSEARARLASEGNKDFGTFSRMAEVAKFEQDYARGQVTPAMTKVQVQKAVKSIREGMQKLRVQLGLFTEAEAPTPQKAVPKKVSRKELVEYAKQVTKNVREAGKLKKYARTIRETLEAAERGDTDLRAEYKRLQRIETRLATEAYEVGEAKQARIGDFDRKPRVKERDDDYAPLDFRKLKFQKTRSQTLGMKAEEVIDLVGKITSRWKNPPNFVVVQSYLDLPEIEGVDPESNADTVGIAVGSDIYIVADNVQSARDLKATVFHESLGHYGLEQLFGERLFQTMLDIYRTNARMRADADAWLAENSDTYPPSDFTQEERQALAVEEVFAEMSESGSPSNAQQRSAFNRVAALVRKFARALGKLAGVDLSYTNAEIDSIVSMAHERVIFGRTQLIPRYNNVRYMKSTYNKVLTGALRKVQSGAPSATKEILTGNIQALSRLPNPLRNAKLATYSMNHIMQLFEKYAPAYRALNNMIERKAYDATQDMIEFSKKAAKYREVLRKHTQYKDRFKKLSHFVNLTQTPLLEEQRNANGDFVRFIPNVAAIQRMRAIPANSAAYNALTPDEKILHEAANEFLALPKPVQKLIIDVYADYRNYSDTAFKVKLSQLLNHLPASAVAAIKANFEKNRLKFYLPLPREGLYKLAYLDNNGTRVSQFFSSLAERDLAEENAARQGFTVLDEPKVLQQRSYRDTTPLPTGLLSELLNNVEDSLKKSNVAKADIESAKETVFDTFIDFMPGAYGNDLRQEISSRKTFMLNGVMYYGRLGFDEDVIGTYEKRIPNLIYQINNLKYVRPFEKVKKLIREQLATYRGNKTSPQYAGLGDLDDDYIRSLEQDLDARITFAKSLQQYSPYVYIISKANYIYSIALNVSSALINTTIIPMMAWPALAAKYGVTDATKAVAQAMQLFFRHSYRDPATGNISFNYKRLADMPASFGGANMPNNYAQTAHGKEFERLQRTLLARSVVGTAAEQELIQAENITVPGYEGLSAKVNLAMSYVFRSSERMNREVTSLAAYMLARNIDVNGNKFDAARGQESVNKALEEAIRLNYDVNGATLPETNSRLYQTDIGRIALTFRTHALNMILNVAFTFNHAIERINANDPNAANRKLLRSIARKKLLYIFGSTYMLSGIKGLPLFGAAEILASLVMGDDDEPYDLEQAVLDEVGTIGLNGPLNELLNADIGSRTGFYGLLWRDDPKRLAEVGIPIYVLERLAGPTYGLVEAARRGLNDLADGEIVRASEALTPAPIRNMIKGMRYATEGALTRDGLPIVEDVSAYNSLMQVLGFAPADLAATQGQRGATYEISEKLKQRRVSLLTNLYAARKAGNSEALEKAMADIRKFNGNNPSYRITMDSINRSFNERERRAREAIMGIYQPKNLRAATAQYVARLDEEDGLIY